MTTMDEVRRLAEHPSDSREYSAGLDAFFRARRSEYKRYAYIVCTQYRLPPDRHFDDVLSLVLESALKLVRDLLDDREGKLERVRSFEGYLSTYVRAAMKGYTGSHAVTAASGMHSVARRRTRYEKTRAELMSELGREPAIDEVVEAANREAHRTRANPQKQGILLTRADAQPVGVEDLEAIRGAAAEPPAILHRLEGEQMVAEIVSAAEVEDPLLGRVARAWIGEFYEGGGHDVVPVAEVAEELGITVKEVNRSIRRLRVIGVRIVNGYLEIA